MSLQRLVLSNFTTGLEKDLKPFNIKNDAFSKLEDFYIFRGRVQRKRGNPFLARLQRNLTDVSLGNSGASPWSFNIYSTMTPSISGQPDAQIVPGTVTIQLATPIGFLDQGNGTLAQYGLITGATQANPCQITSVGHNLITGATVFITGVGGMTQLNNNSYVITVTGANTFTLNGINSTGYTAYISGGQWISTTAGNSGTINYSTGNVVLTYTGSSAEATTITFSYYPALPALGIEDFNIGNSPQPIIVAFDQEYSYEFDQGLNQFYDVTFYKETGLPFIWNGENYQQFWTTNYLGLTTILISNESTGCLWATNGNPGFHFLTIHTLADQSSTTITMTLWNGGAPFTTLIDGDVLWFNEVANAGPVSANINGMSGTVTDDSGAATGTYVVTFATAVTITGWTGTGIAQMLTNFLPDQDGIRWYDGDPTITSDNGWVNFAPPLNAYNPVMGATQNVNPNYLVGAKMVLPFKNRLLFFGTYQSTSLSSPGPLFYPNRVVYSQVGTPFYALPLPSDLASQKPDPTAWYQNVSGKGGFIGAPIDDRMVFVGENEDNLITIFETQPLALIFTSNDTIPFVFQTISAELGGITTFAGIKLDTGILSIGPYGFTMTTSTSVQRIDLQIPDDVFDISQAANQANRITGIRDYQKEFVYFTFCPSSLPNINYNSRTLLYNYRENNWASFEESFTCYGTLRRTTNRTWSNIGQIYGTWSGWNDPWNFGLNNAFSPVILGGTQQGFILQRGLSTEEGPSRFIQAINQGVVPNTITSPDHALQNQDFILISGMLGSTNLNGTVQQVNVIDTNTFSINGVFTGTYLGSGVFAKLSQPSLQTKQFPIYWNDGRQVRLGTMRLLFDTTPLPQSDAITNATQANPCQITSPSHGLQTGTTVYISGVMGMVQLNGKSYVITVVDGNNFTLNSTDSTAFNAYVSGGQWAVAPPQVTVNIYSNQNSNTAANDPNVQPYLAFTNIVLTCPENDSAYSTGQAQTWHRLSPSFNGDTIQIGVTLTDAQMLDNNLNQQEIILHAIVLDLYPGPVLA